MLPEDNIENRHAPPGVNSRSATAAQAAADLEVLNEIEDIYFSCESEQDAARYALEHAPSPPTCEGIEQMFNKLKKQQQVVSGKALHLISQQRDKCDREFSEIQNIKDELSTTIKTCRDARAHLKSASECLTVATFVILANYRKRQLLRTVLKNLELLKNLRNIEIEVNELIAKKEYEEAIKLILKSIKAAAEHKEFTCIKDLAVRLQDTLEMTEEKLDSVLASLCFNFDDRVFLKLRNAYNLLGKTQSAMEQLHMHYSSAINESSVDALKPYLKNVSLDLKFQDLCQNVQPNKAPICLLNLCENLFLVMKSYFLLVKWHDANDDAATSSNVFDIEMNVTREYIKQKLKAGLLRLWSDIQGKISKFLQSAGLDELPFEKFIQMLGILKRLTQIAEVFCGDKSDLLQDFIKSQSVTYIKNYHRGRMDELKLFLENEGWEQCPVKSTFNVLSLQEFRPFKKYMNQNKDLNLSRVSQSDGASSVNSQDESVILKKYFNPKTLNSPFEIFRDENITNEDIFGVEKDTESGDDSDDEPDELRREFVDDDVHDKVIESPSKIKDSVIVTNTTLSVLRNCGQYLQICRYLPQISLEVVMLMNQLFDYYFFTIHLFFTSDLDVASSTLYSSKLNGVLKRISNIIDTNCSNPSDNVFVSPDIPSHLDMTSDDNLHGLAERIVAVESVIFLAKQFDIMHPYLEAIVAQHQKVVLDHFRDNTLTAAVDLRMPVYMGSASKAIDAKSALLSMSQVKWDVKEVALENSPYVDVIVRKIQMFAMRFENLSAKVSLNMHVVQAVWSVISKFIVHLLVEGFSNATKCSNAGRGLMQLDYRQLFLKLEKISGLKPIPYQDYVDRYVKAYYLPRNELEEFIKDRTEYSNKHLIALVTCSCENKKDRQALISILDEKE